MLWRLGAGREIEFKGERAAVVVGCTVFLVGCVSEPAKAPRSATIVYKYLSGAGSYGPGNHVTVEALP